MQHGKIQRAMNLHVGIAACMSNALCAGPLHIQFLLVILSIHMYNKSKSTRLQWGSVIYNGFQKLTEDIGFRYLSKQ